ncbi:MAG: sigma factor-like helix-turn-helix DNA-binding protein [bacterium]|nr:sigma factor-like helix-turn-helix DNA-binding protein [bacterium]
MSKKKELTNQDKALAKAVAPKAPDPSLIEAENLLKEKIEEVLKLLTYRQREILKLRYGIGEGNTHTLEEVGCVFKTTRERVRQMEAKAIRKLQHPIQARKLEGFLPGGLSPQQ